MTDAKKEAPKKDEKKEKKEAELVRPTYLVTL